LISAVFFLGTGLIRSTQYSKTITKESSFLKMRRQYNTESSKNTSLLPMKSTNKHCRSKFKRWSSMRAERKSLMLTLKKNNHHILAFSQKRIMTTPSTIATGAHFLINAFMKLQREELTYMYTNSRWNLNI
jgi:hypothetical protein